MNITQNIIVQRKIQNNNIGIVPYMAMEDTHTTLSDKYVICVYSFDIHVYNLHIVTEDSLILISMPSLITECEMSKNKNMKEKTNIAFSN